MRIALIGYGKMGQLIGDLAEAKGHEISHKISSHNSSEIHNLEDTDVAIEFTHPDAAIMNFEHIAAQNIPIVTGTTGWMHTVEELEALVNRLAVPFFYTSNFSLGVHITTALSIYLAGLMEHYPHYNCRIDEWHHKHKKDAPSGTALSLAGDIVKHHQRYNSYKYVESEVGAKDELPIFVYRKDEIPGTHQISYDSDIDCISLRHKAKSRNGFAHGAISAASFLIHQNAGLYSMNDLIKT